MSNHKYRVIVDLYIDTDEYRIPADGNIRASLKEDIKDALESSILCKVTGMGVSKLLIPAGDDACE